MISFLESHYDIFTVTDILSSLLICLAINLDCRARNIAKRKLYTILSFFFPVIVGIVYCVKRKGEKSGLKVCASCGQIEPADRRQCTKCGGFTLLEYKNPKAKKLKTISVILCVIGCIAFVVNAGTNLYYQKDSIKQIISGEYEDDEEYAEDTIVDQELMYDKNGIAYSDFDDIKYYDADNKEYHKKYIDVDVLFVDEDGNEFDSNQCVIDEDGILYTETNKAPEGKKTYPAAEVNWDYTGTMYYLGEEIE